MSTLLDRRWLIASAFFAVAFVLANVMSTAAAPQSQAVPAQNLECSWNNIDRTTPSFFHVASAYDSVNNKVYYFGGVDQSGEETDFLGELDVSGADIGSANVTRLRPAGTQERYGAIGFFRPDGEDSAAYFIGGSRDAASGEGNGEDDVFKYTPESGQWSTELQGAGLSEVLFSAAAYDPENDMAVVYGGTSKCNPADEAGPDNCRGSTQFSTRLLKFDAMTKKGQWEQCSGCGLAPGQVYGATMVYDSANKQMLLYGGTTDGSRANSEVYALPLDPIGSWSRVTVGGANPGGRFFHSATYDTDNNWMIVQGGLTSGLHSRGENTNASTFALDMSDPMNPAWVNLDTSPTGIAERIGATMDYVANHSSAVIHMGRGRFQSADSQRTTGNTDALSCMMVTPEPSPTTGPTSTPRPTQPGGGGGDRDPWVPPAPDPATCDSVVGKVPDAVVQAKAGNPPSEYDLCNPNAPISPFNLYKDKLSLQDVGKPYHPIFNRLVWKCGCP